MDATIKYSSLERLAGVEPARGWTDAVRISRYCWLSELPGLAFGLLTVAYIVASLIALR